MEKDPKSYDANLNKPPLDCHGILIYLRNDECTVIVKRVFIYPRLTV